MCPETKAAPGAARLDQRAFPQGLGRMTSLTRTGPGGAVTLRTSTQPPRGAAWQTPRVPADLSQP